MRLLHRWSLNRAHKLRSFAVATPPDGPLSRNSFPIWVDAPAYDLLSGGARAMNLLCHRLGHLGYDAFIIKRPMKGDAPLAVRYLSHSIVKQHKRERREPIVVYSEAAVGNPRNARFVVRYLLNKPGFIAPGAESSYGEEDYFIDGAREHAPPGVRSFDLFMPLVDRSAYFPPAFGSRREGFAIFTNRAVVEPAALPEWLRPYTLLSIKNPRSHAELGTLYRQTRAMVTFERTSAIFEALSCGCPVICIGKDSDNFTERTWQPRFEMPA